MSELQRFSIVIRNKNEAPNLKKTLKVLTSNYSHFISDLILVDNCSGDNSREIAREYNCKVILIENFTYGRASNLGIRQASEELVLLLSSHCVPIGNYFFMAVIEILKYKKNIAGFRFVNNYNEYFKSFEVDQSQNLGLNAACGIVCKSVWEKHKFNENLIALEDKEWSNRVIENGFSIESIRETYFYFIRRDSISERLRNENEYLATFSITSSKIPNKKTRYLKSLIYQIFWLNPISFFDKCLTDVRAFYRLFKN